MQPPGACDMCCERGGLQKWEGVPIKKKKKIDALSDDCKLVGGDAGG